MEGPEGRGGPKPRNMQERGTGEEKREKIEAAGVIEESGSGSERGGIGTETEGDKDHLYPLLLLLLGLINVVHGEGLCHVYL